MSDEHSVRGPLIVSAGSVNADFQVRTERWPRPGETLLADEFLSASGGKAANVAFLARRLGAPARLVACVGDDLLADRALDPLREIGVELAHVRRLAGQETGVSLIDVRADGEKAILLAANANAAWGAEGADQAREAVAAAPAGSVLAVNLEAPIDAVRAAMRAARAADQRVVLDPSPADRMDDALWEHVDYVTPNRAEAETLTGVSVRSPTDGVRAAELLLERGVRHAVVKLGGEGCVLVDGDRRLRARAEPRDAVDATGAGDAFAGGLVVALLERRAVDDVLRHAVAASALAVLAFGSQASYPSRDRLAGELGRVAVWPAEDDT